MTDSKYMTLAEEHGNIKISEEVIASIAVGAAREVDGVADMVNNLTGSVSDQSNCVHLSMMTMSGEICS